MIDLGDKKKEKIFDVIAHELIGKEIENSILFLQDHTKLTNAINYHNSNFNEAKSKEFELYTEVLQKIVDAYYFNYYEVGGWIKLTKENYKEVLKENLTILENMKKLLKFIA